jgi:hypothetical protein
VARLGEKKATTVRVRLGREMNNDRVFGALAGLLSITACVGAATAPPTELFVGQIAYVATSAEARQGFYYVPEADEAVFGVVPRTDKVPPANPLIAACDYDQNRTGQFALVRLYYYWLDASKEIVSFSRWTIVDDNLALQRGNVVEVEVRSKPGGARCAVVKKVRAARLEEVECEYRDNKRNAALAALSKFSPAGGPGAASLYCPFLTSEGWKAEPTGPYAGGFGGFAWSKIPP